jgi:hypothetical protein
VGWSGYLAGRTAEDEPTLWICSPKKGQVAVIAALTFLLLEAQERSRRPSKPPSGRRRRRSSGGGTIASVSSGRRLTYVRVTGKA